VEVWASCELRARRGACGVLTWNERGDHYVCRKMPLKHPPLRGHHFCPMKRSGKLRGESGKRMPGCFNLPIETPVPDRPPGIPPLTEVLHGSIHLARGWTRYNTRR
jgi:hypothetical protein